MTVTLVAMHTAVARKAKACNTIRKTVIIHIRTIILIFNYRTYNYSEYLLKELQPIKISVIGQI